MSADRDLNGRMMVALAELEGIIRRRYPDAQFQVTRSQDDPAVLHLTAIVDVEDTEEVVDTVIARMMELQIEEELPIFVIPVRPRERVAALLESQPPSGSAGPGRAFPSPERHHPLTR